MDTNDPSYKLSLALQKDKDFAKAKEQLHREMEEHAKEKNMLSIQAAEKAMQDKKQDTFYGLDQNLMLNGSKKVIGTQGLISLEITK